ncbi:hypothetical protein Mapa_008778 [Marchantia paleacea]|nr:hypothetical protein Mapa_008778 [Marchantia paleacea]
MSRFNGPAAMELCQQHSGGSISSISYGSQGALGGYVDLDGANSIPSPSSGGLGNLNTSLASNITADFGGSFLESSSQNSLNRALGSATVIPFSQSQTQSQTQAGSLIVADEWSGTSNGIPGTSNTQPQQQVVQSSSSHGLTQTPSGALEGFNSAKQLQQQAFDSHPSTKLQGVQDMLANQPSSTGEGDGSDLTFSHNRGVSSFLSPGFQSGNQLLSFSVPEKGKAQNQDTGFIGGQSQNLPSGLLLQQSHSAVDGQELNYHSSSIPSGTGRMEEPDLLKGVLDNLHKGNAHIGGVHGQLDSATSSLIQDAGNFAAKLHGGQASNQQLSYRGQLLSPQSSLQGQPSSNLQPHRTLGGQGQGGLYQSQLRNHSPQANGQQINYHRLLNTASHLSSLSGLSNAQAILHAQAGGSHLSQYQNQGHGVNQQLSFNQQSLQQSRQPQAGNQQLFHTVPSYQTGQQQNFQLHSGAANPRPHAQRASAEQIFAHLQPRMQSQILQNMKAGSIQSFQAAPSIPGSNARDLTDGSVRGSVNIASTCSHVLMQFVQEQRKRPADNNIGFWKKLVHNFFEPGATKRWCLTSYNSQPVGRHAQGLFPMEYWFCNLCQVQPGRGFESTMDMLPRLLKIQYDSGLLDELLFLDAAEERCVYSPSGVMCLEYPKAVHEAIFPELRVVRYGRLRVSFSSSFKMRTWEFCTQNHEEVVPRKNLIQQAHHLASLVNEYDADDFDKSVENLTKHCNLFTATAKQLAAKLEAPIINDLGFSKRYVRCLQIAEVVNSMKDLMDYEWKLKCGAIASLATFPSTSKLQMESVITGLPTLSQVIDHITQCSFSGGPSPRQQSSTLSSPQMFPNVQNQVSTAISSSSPLSRIWDPSVSKLSSPSPRTQMDSRSVFNQMQPPTSQFNPLGSSQVHLGNVTGNSHGTSPFQYPSSSHLSQLQGQLPSSPSGQGHQSQGLFQAQLYQQLLAKQQLSQQPGQILSQSQSLNQTGQQSLPGTPQSEMSDMRS